MPLIINDAEAVCVTIGGDADISPTLDDFLGERLQGLGVRRGKPSTKECARRS